ncbi:MAG: hypothetical protein KC776_23355 [Myxococcales bacterium]|nr:hypothetical protein [Myxococcales bacterium]MCB9575474.1 hypothetical protein [Polyangiaceae bacterium]
MDAVALGGGEVALELYDVLRGLDRAGWRDDVSTAFRDRLGQIQQRVTHIVNASAATKSALRERLNEVGRTIRESAPAEHSAPREAWLAFRARVIPAYEALAQGLRAQAVDVPSLRPKNWTRSAFHVLSGLTVLLLVEEVLSLRGIIIAPAIFAGTFWFLEVLRRVSPRANDGLMWIFRPIAHPHERHRVNSSTWYATALLTISFIQEQMVCAVAVAVLALADPMAALIGRRFGKLRIAQGRSLEGTLAFFVTGVLAAVVTLLVWHSATPMLAVIGVAVAASAVAAVVELFSKLDDNFTVPVAAAAGAWVAALALGAI